MSWLQERLEYLGTFPTKDNWDSYGGLPTSDTARELAKKVFGWLARKGFPKPHIEPTGRGGVGISWGDEVLWIEIRNDGAVVTSFMDDDPALETA